MPSTLGAAPADGKDSASKSLPPADLPKVTVVILNAKGIALLRRCYESVCRSSYARFDVIVVDCLSPDIGAFRPADLPRTEVMHLDVDVGPAEQHNIGAAHASVDSKYLAFVDNDVELDEHWMQSLVDALESAPEQVACAAGCTRDTGRGRYVDDLVLQYPGVQHVRYADTPSPGKRLVDFQPGEAFLVRRDVFLAVGGYDSSFFIYSDDSDFGWRLRVSGYNIWLVPEARALHHRSATAGKNPRFRGLRVRNGMLSAFKNLQARSLPMLALNETLRFVGLAVGSLIDSEARELFRSYLAGLASLPRLDIRGLLSRRKAVQRSRKRDDREIFNRSPLESARVLGTGEVDLPMLKAYFLISAILFGLLPRSRPRS